MRLSDFKVLTFDCYGTLIDWESGIFAALEPLLTAAPLPRNEALQAFARHEADQQEQTPDMVYPDLLAEVHRRLAKELGVGMPDDAHRRFGASVPDWPAFPDSAQALHDLKQHHQLVILSNVDRDSFRSSNRKLGVVFDAIYTAQDVGSYKPNPANFHYMLDHLAARGVQPGDILHTAQSLFHDHAPARALGLASVWIDRRHSDDGWGATRPEPGAAYDVRFTGMAEMAAARRAEMLG